MGDLISRCELFNKLAPVQTLGEAYAVIQGMQTAPEVIRCKDCEYQGKELQIFKGYYYCQLMDTNMKPDDYCSYAERRTDAVD